MSKPRIPSRTAFETAFAYLREHGLDGRGFSVSADGTVTVLPADKPVVVSEYDRWKQQGGAA